MINHHNILLDCVVTSQIKNQLNDVDIEASYLYAIEVTPETSTFDASIVPTKAPIVLIHDSLGSVKLWKTFPQQLANVTCRRVIAYDRLGFGESSAQSVQLTTNFITLEAEQILPQLFAYFTIDRFIVLGHSVGGGMACIIAEQHADRCIGLIAISTQAFNDAQIRASIHDNYRSFEDARNFERLARYHGDKTQWVLDAWAQTWLSEAFENWSMLEQLNRIICPTLIIQGEQDEYNQVIHSQTLSQHIPQNRLVILPDTGHFLHRQHSAEVLKTIETFVSTLE